MPPPPSPPPSLNAAYLPATAVGLGIAALACAYAMATHDGTQPTGITNLPDITHCVLKMPERGVFLFLFMPACALMAMSWWMTAAGNGACGTVGVIACVLLIMGEAALDAHPNWTIHTIGATGFFLLSGVAQVMRAISGPGDEPASLRAKRIIAAIFVLLLVADGALALVKAPSWSTNLIEWTLAVDVVFFHATIAYDLRGSRLQLLAPQTSRVTPNEALLASDAKLPPMRA
jgi:hypothetical protein